MPSERAMPLAARPGVRRVPSRQIELFILPAFLVPESCREFIALIDANRRPSTIADDNGEAGFRTSETCDLDRSNPAVAAVEAEIAALLEIAPGHGEPLQGQRYQVGQEFRLHTDTFNPIGADYFEHCAVGGQRTWTAMIYLNDVEAGGATRFKKIGKIIQPAEGTLVAWNNLLPDGRPNDATLHQGMKVRTGVKYVLTKWFRERPYG